jgi:hypothetical protein
MSNPTVNRTDQGRKRIDCRQCVHFFVTWEKSHPYGCKGHNFKSRQIPSQVVFASSGMDCLLFKAKTLTSKQGTAPRR